MCGAMAGLLEPDGSITTAPLPRNRRRVSIPEVGFCGEKKRLQNAFLKAIHELNTIQGEQAKAVIEDDPDFCRFDILLHIAQKSKDLAKYAWMAHVEEHGCHDGI